MAGSLGGLNLGLEKKDGSYHAPPSSQLLGMQSHRDYHVPQPQPATAAEVSWEWEVSCTNQTCWLPPLPWILVTAAAELSAQLSRSWRQREESSG